MPRALGRDRLDVAPNGRLLLTCLAPKGWIGRSPATPTSAEHPGTAVRWEEGLFEVLEVRPLGGSSVTYVLAAWDERHAIRVVSAYDAAAEATRRAEEADVARRSDRHVYLLLLAPLVGSLPAHVQERLEREYAVPAHRLSLSSALPLFIVGWLALILLFASSVGAHTAIPPPVLVFGVYLLAESTARLVACVLQSRPIGTLAGTLLYEAWRQLGRAKARAEGRPLPREKAVWETGAEADADRLVEDRYGMVEPVAALLPAADQALLAERFGFDGLRWGRLTAIFLLVMFGPLAVSSVLGALVVFEAADVWRVPLFGGIAAEQVLRLVRLRKGLLAPSVLGFLVRPFARPLLG